LKVQRFIPGVPGIIDDAPLRGFVPRCLRHAFCAGIVELFQAQFGLDAGGDIRYD
jgi:hypothetical protein